MKEQQRMLRSQREAEVDSEREESTQGEKHAKALGGTKSDAEEEGRTSVRGRTIGKAEPPCRQATHTMMRRNLLVIDMLLF